MKITDLIVVVVFLCSDVISFMVVINYDMVMIRSAEASDTEGLVRLGDYKAIIKRALKISDIDNEVLSH